jgi:hypothetical protein
MYAKSPDGSNFADWTFVSGGTGTYNKSKPPVKTNAPFNWTYNDSTGRFIITNSSGIDTGSSIITLKWYTDSTGEGYETGWGTLFTFTLVRTPSSTKDITAFSILGNVGTIGANSIAVTVPYGTSLVGLVATFTMTGVNINIGGTNQVSTTTANDFTLPKTYTVVAENATTKNYTVTVVAILPPSSLTYSGSAYIFDKNIAITIITPTVTGTVTSCTSSPTLPVGLSINATTCAISGTPTVSQAANLYTITASNGQGNTTANISISVFPPVDDMNGTVFIARQNLIWAKCPQVDTSGANMYNAGLNDCSGGVAGAFQYCSALDNSCDNGTILNGTGTSGVWSTCNNMNTNPVGGFAGRTSWRVPTFTELIAFLNVYTVNTSLFPSAVPNSPYNVYWSSSLYVPNPTGYALYVNFPGGSVNNMGNKTNANYERCVSTGP